MNDVRRSLMSRHVFKWAKGALPTLSATEAEALEAGEVWWDAELFTGSPDWSKLLATKRPQLTEEEQHFLDHQCEQLCSMVDDWSISWEHGDLPAEVWQYLRDEKFFGLIISRDFGGLGFSAYAHSEIVRKISTRSIALGVTTMVPNSLGPGELLHLFGTDEQQQYWLPRLACGEDVPAFALTSEEAGSDASAMIDSGIVCEGEWHGEQVMGIRLNWSKRYITLGPVSTVLGLAFKLYDPDGLLGDEPEPGITCVLVPTDLPGVDIGRRHIPSGQMFQNGPTRGEDVFVPLDHIIGGPACAGQGWKMLMTALAVGRGVSLPSLSAAATALSAHTASAYSRVRRQFGIPIGKFEGIQNRLGRLAAESYVLDAARRLTCAGLDEGKALAVISGIMKANATYRMRAALDDAMDVHAGKAVIDGPRNYIGNIHRAVPVAITVEGANILTRNMIIFGQGAIRCHPHILDEMLALQMNDDAQALDAFDKALWAHVGHTVKNLLKAGFRAWTGGRWAPAPAAGAATVHYQQLSRWASAFALTADVALITLGGSLKRREMLSARMGDVLSELYMLSAALKRWEDEGRQEQDLPVLHYAMDDGLYRIRHSLDEVLVNLPSRLAAGFVRVLTLPGGANRGPSDELTRQCAALILEPSATRDRLVENIYGGCSSEGIHELNEAYRKVCETETLREQLSKSGKSAEEAVSEGSMSESDARRLQDADEAVARVIAVDDFAAEDITERCVARKPPDRQPEPQAASEGDYTDSGPGDPGARDNPESESRTERLTRHETARQKEEEQSV